MTPAFHPRFPPAEKSAPDFLPTVPPNVDKKFGISDTVPGT
jgi:hypothetical protein